MDILDVPAVRNEKYYTCCTEPYVDITFSISMRRKTLFYTVNLIIPCMFISFLTVLVFYLPSDSGEKVTLSISILLSLTVFFLLLAEIIPPTSMAVPLLGKYLLFTMILVTLSICVTVVVLNVHFRSPQTHTMSPWVRRVFIHILPRLLVMRRPPNANFPVTGHRPPQPQPPPQVPAVRSCNGAELRDPFRDERAASTLRLREASRDCCLHGEGCAHALAQRESRHAEYSTPRDYSFDNLGLGSGEGQCRIHGHGHGTSLSAEELDPMGHSVCCRSPSEYINCPEVQRATEGVRYISEHVRYEEDSDRVKEDWKYVAMVLDRLFLWIFTMACVVGTAGIILQAPTLYDDRSPIDKTLSEIASTLARPDLIKP